jgi:hypothetical protein
MLERALSTVAPPCTVPAWATMQVCDVHAVMCVACASSKALRLRVDVDQSGCGREFAGRIRRNWHFVRDVRRLCRRESALDGHRCMILWPQVCRVTVDVARCVQSSWSSHVTCLSGGDAATCVAMLDGGADRAIRDVDGHTSVYLMAE